MYYKNEIELNIGTSNNTLKLVPNMEGGTTYIYKINSFNNTEIVRKERDFEVRKAKIYNQNGEILIDNFHFWTHNYFNFDNVLAISRNFDDSLESITHVFYYQKLIEHLSFGLEFENKNDINNTNIFLHLGGFPKDKIKGKFISHCNTLNLTQWACKLIKVNFNGVEFTNCGIVYFDVFFKNFFVPSTFVTFIENNYFMKLIDSEKCRKEVDKNLNEIEYICKNKLIKEFPKIEFVFDNFAISVRDEIIKDDNSFNFRIDNRHRWYFSSHFMRKYSFLFDYENDIVVLYSDESMSLNKNIKSNIIFFIINHIIIFIGIFILLYQNFIIKSDI